MKIVNKTSLNYSTIGMIIDDIINKNSGDTHYYGKVGVATFLVESKKISLTIRYLKRYVEWYFTEVKDDNN